MICLGYYDVYHFLRFGTYLEGASIKDRRALRHLATRFVMWGVIVHMLN